MKRTTARTLVAALLCATAAAAGAEVSHVLDDFATTKDIFTFKTPVPPVSTMDVTPTSDGVQLDYRVGHLDMYAGFPFVGRILGEVVEKGGDIYRRKISPCAKASYLRVEYRVLEPAQTSEVRLVVALGDASGCARLSAPGTPGACATSGVQGLIDRETYSGNLENALDDASGEWKVVRPETSCSTRPTAGPEPWRCPSARPPCAARSGRRRASKRERLSKVHGAMTSPSRRRASCSTTTPPP